MVWEPRSSILPPEWPLVQRMFHAAREAVEASAVFLPMVMWSTEGNEGIVALAGIHGGVSGALDGALDMVTSMYGELTGFAVLVDAYGRITDAEEGIDPDDLADRFTMGDPGVVEQMMLLVAHEGEIRVWRQVYRYTPVDGWEWEHPQLMSHAVLPESGLLETVKKWVEQGSG